MKSWCIAIKTIIRKLIRGKVICEEEIITAGAVLSGHKNEGWS